MKVHKMTAWEAGNDLCSCADYLGEKEEEVAAAGFTEHAKLIRDCRVRIANFFNRNHGKTHDFGLGPTKRRPTKASRAKPEQAARSGEGKE